MTLTICAARRWRNAGSLAGFSLVASLTAALGMGLLFYGVLLALVLFLIFVIGPVNAALGIHLLAFIKTESQFDFTLLAIGVSANLALSCWGWRRFSKLRAP